MRLRRRSCRECDNELRKSVIMLGGEVLSGRHLVEQSPCEIVTFSTTETRRDAPINTFETRQESTNKIRVKMNSGDDSCWRNVC